MRHALALLPLALGFSTLSLAEVEKEDLTFVGLRVTDLELRSVHGEKTANTIGSEFVIGSYITDYVKVEGRIGGGWASAESEPGVEFDIDGYASWYMGAQYPIIEYLWIYGQFGFTFIKGGINRDDPNKYEEVPDKLFTSSFSASYALGLDYHLFDTWYANLEVGRIHRDSETKIRTMQIGLGIKYDF